MCCVQRSLFQKIKLYVFEHNNDGNQESKQNAALNIHMYHKTLIKHNRVMNQHWYRFKEKYVYKMEIYVYLEYTNNVSSHAKYIQTSEYKLLSAHMGDMIETISSQNWTYIFIGTYDEKN